MASVQALHDKEVWRWTDATPWAGPLLNSALSRSETRKQGDVRENAKHPTVFVLTYRDGLKAAVYMLDGHIADFNFAGHVEGKNEPDSTLFWLQPGRPFSHFSTLVHWIEEMMVTGAAAYPVERTLLVSGTLEACMTSAWKGDVVIETPHLEVRYIAPKESRYNRGPVPPAREEI